MYHKPSATLYFNGLLNDWHFINYIHALIDWLVPLDWLMVFCFLQLKGDLEQALTNKTEMEAVVSQKQDLLSQWESQIADVIQW